MLLSIDLGTGSVKALLMTIAGTIVAETSSAYSVQSLKPGWAETDPEDWWSAVIIAVKTVVAERAHQVQAIGLSGQMHGVVLADSHGQPLRPAILWADMRSSSVLKIYDAIDSTLRNSLANPITAGMAGPTLLWLKQYEPDCYANARWSLQPKDWLRFRLTSEVTAEPSDASGTLLYDVARDLWAEEVIHSLDLRSDWFPPLVASASIAGYLTTQASESLGLPTGLPVVAGAADTAAAAVGTGLLDEGQVQLTIGTGAQIITLRAQPSLDPQGQTHLYRTALPAQWYTLAAIQNAGLALEWVRNLLGLSWKQVYSTAFSVMPGCDGLTFLPYLTGERTPHLDPNARGAWAGLALHHTRSHMMRAALEGVTFSIQQGVAAIRATGIEIHELRLAGGGTLEPAWQQLLADVLEVPLYSVTVPSASARGAAILAGMGIGAYPNIQAIPYSAVNAHPTTPQPLVPQLKFARQRFQDLYPALRQWSQDSK
jgi:xylulokinase